MSVSACSRHCYGHSRTGAARCVVWLQLHTLACNLGNFLRTLAPPEPIKEWPLTSLKEKLIKIGAKDGRYVAFQMAEVAIPRQLFQQILWLIAELRPQPSARTGMRCSMVMRSRAARGRSGSKCQQK
jgi:Transposase DDE domain group 1